MAHPPIWPGLIIELTPMQHDVYANPLPVARRAYPFVAVLQSDLAETGRDRTVAFLAPRRTMAAVVGRLMPVIVIRGEEYVLLIPSLTSIRSADLHDVVDNIGAHRDRIGEALDWLFFGV